jgi:hypothetical protein
MTGEGAIRRSRLARILFQARPLGFAASLWSRAASNRRAE